MCFVFNSSFAEFLATMLSEIKKPIEQELALFEKKFKEAMKSNTALLDIITQYILKRKGKQMRPMFVFLSAKISGSVTESTYTAATMIELLHTATLVHDDVVDDAYERRGFFSINALWKNKISVLVGDYLLSKGLLISTEKGEFELLRLMSGAVKDMSEGELLQIEKARKLDIKEAIYYEIIRKKTASLIATACAAGAASTGISPEKIQEMYRIGEAVGMAFQIKDDLFDYGKDDVGKPLGIDIKERKMTLPLIYTLSVVDASTKKKIINTVKNKNTNEALVSEVIRLVQTNGGIAYAEKIMYQYIAQAEEILKNFPDSEAKEAFKKLVEFTIKRNT